MSPEQATGDQSLSPATDVYSLGCVLFEMLIGQPPFAASSTPAVLAKVLTSDPPSVVEARRSVPDNVADAIRRALEKVPADRFDSALGFGEAISDDGFRYRHRAPASSRTRAQAAVGAVAVGLLVAGWMLLSASDASPPVLQNPRQITAAIGLEEGPTWSPDGSRIAYQSNQTGDPEIWQALAAGGEPVNLTQSPGTRDVWPAWSPDGTQIAFASDGWPTQGCYVVSALGGTPEFLTAGGLGRPAWSSDGTELACIFGDIDGPWTDIVNLNTREVARLPLPGSHTLRYDLAWSPDRRFLAYVDSPELQAQATILQVLRLEDGVVLQASEGTSRVASPTWDASGRFLFYASDRRGSMDLWRQEVAADGTSVGEPVQVTTGLQIRSASFSPDGTRFAYFTFDQAYAEYLDVSADGQFVLFNSDRGGDSDIWVRSADGSVTRQLAANPLPDWDPKLSADGSRVAFYSARSGNRDIWVVPFAGGVASQVTDHPALEWQPSWSPDGSRLAFISSRETGAWKVWLANADGSEARPLTTGSPAWENFPMWSPDGEWILFVSPRGEGNDVDTWRASANSDTPLTDVEFVREGSGYTRWSLDGRRIYALEPGNSRIRVMDLASREERTVADFFDRAGRLGRFALASDGSYLYFTWEEHLGDIWVMDVVQE
jgi:Tol biopolymer transport system component